VHVQVVHDQGDSLCFFVMGGDFRQKAGPFMLGFSLVDRHHPLAGQGFTGKKGVTHAAAAVFVVVTLRLAPGRPGWTGASLRSTAWRLVHAYHRMARIVGAHVDIQDHLHVRHKAAVFFRRNQPSFALPGLEDVFFRARRTVSCEI
jgi:hypothetical protein